MRTFFLGLFLFTLPLSVSAQVLWTVGPMLHYNWGKGGHGLSYGLEASLWTPVDIAKPGFTEAGEDPMVGFDLGFELQGRKTRIYSEAQYGIITPANYLGVSAGPYLEIQEGRATDFGLQGSLLDALVLGLDLRARVGASGAVLSPGLFAKIGTCFENCDL